MNESNCNLQIKSSTSVNIQMVTNYVVKPAFMMVGTKLKRKRGIEGYDLVAALLNFNSDMRWMFKLLMDGLNTENNCCDFNLLNLTHTQKVNCSLAYTALSKIDLVKRMRKGIYMINPKAIIPPTTYPEAQKLWDSKPNKNLIESSSEELSDAT